MTIETQTWTCSDCGAINGLGRIICGLCKEPKVRNENDTE